MSRPTTEYSEAPVKKRTLVIAVAATSLVLLLGCCAVFAALSFFGSDDNGGGYSEEQQAVLEDLGPPDTFTLMFGEIADEEFDEEGNLPTHRLEYWEYWDSSVRIVFRDGRYIRHDTLEALPAGTYEYPALELAWFDEGMSGQEVADKIGAAPDKAARLLPGSELGLGTITFADQVAATFEDGKLVMIQTAPVKTAEVSEQ
ncbi:MAG: hypothetical protein U1E22_01795 [Coriobacteriia bacterium]|nr:hypothetical protein [Coriobacteriia bacterium]